MYIIRHVLLFFIILCLGFNFVSEEAFCEELSAKDKEIAAEVNGKVITVRELENPLSDQIYQLEMEIFEVKKKKLDELIGNQLLKEEAAKQDISVEELLNKEVYSKVPDVTDEQVERFYQQNKHLLVNRPEAELKKKAREILEKRIPIIAKNKYIKSLRDKAKISIYLKAPETPEGASG